MSTEDKRGWVTAAEAAAQSARDVARALARVDDERQDGIRWRFIAAHATGAQFHFNKDSANSLKTLVLTIKTTDLSGGIAGLEREIDAAIVRAAASMAPQEKAE